MSAAKISRATKLNLGSGPQVFDGWTSVDSSPNVLLSRLLLVKMLLRRIGLLDIGQVATWPPGITRVNLAKGLPVRDGSIRAIYCSHVLEHLYLDDARRLLAECRRVLCPDGVLRLALPDAEQIARDLLEAGANANASLAYNEALGTSPFSPLGLLSRCLSIFGLSGTTHRWQPTAALTEQLLRDAGFVDISRCEYRQGRLPDLESVEYRRESFFLEASASYTGVDQTHAS